MSDDAVILGRDPFRDVQDDSIIDDIEVARSKNNVNWMQILRIAMKHAPDETREVLHKIVDKDLAVTMMMRSLAR